MDHRMRLVLLAHLALLLVVSSKAFIPGADGPVSNKEGLEGGNTTFYCDTSTAADGDELMLLVWYRNNAPIYSFDARSSTEWSNPTFNESNRLHINRTSQPSALTITNLREDDEALYHCRVDFLLSPTKNIGVNLSITVRPSSPFFLDEQGDKVENKVGPYHEGDTLVISCLVIGGHPPPRITWYSGDTLVDASDGASEVPSMRENELYLPLGRDHNAPLTCQASNTELAPPVVSSLVIELYLSPQNVSIHWVEGADKDETLQAGRPAIVQCKAEGSYPAPKITWWLNHHHLTKHSNQSVVNETVTSFLEVTPTVSDDGATLSCIATNEVMAPDRGSKADVIVLNVTYSPIVEVSRIGNGKQSEVVELDTLYLDCEIRANPVADKIEWYFYDSKITPGGQWGDNTSSSSLVVEEATRDLSGSYSCAAINVIGETRANYHNITVLYPPECTRRGITLIQETIHCNVKALPEPDTYFWHVTPMGFETQHLTTGSSMLPLSQIVGPLNGPLQATCEAGNGIASQDKQCSRTFSLEHLRPSKPQQCDLVYELEEFQIRCAPVDNATYYELSVWRMSTSNTSLILAHRGTMGWSTGQALTNGPIPWVLRGNLGKLTIGDEAGASACNRFGCSRATLLRPTEKLISAAAPPWWHYLLEKDVGISIGAVLLMIVFLISTYIVVRAARRTRKGPVVQVLQLEDLARDYVMDQKRYKSCSVRSYSSACSDSAEWEPPSLHNTLPLPALRSARSPSSLHSLIAPPVPRERKPLYWHPPPDVTITPRAESAV